MALTDRINEAFRKVFLELVAIDTTAMESQSAISDFTTKLLQTPILSLKKALKVALTQWFEQYIDDEGADRATIDSKINKIVNELNTELSDVRSLWRMRAISRGAQDQQEQQDDDLRAPVAQQRPQVQQDDDLGHFRAPQVQQDDDLGHFRTPQARQRPQVQQDDDIGYFAPPGQQRPRRPRVQQRPQVQQADDHWQAPPQQVPDATEQQVSLFLKAQETEMKRRRPHLNVPIADRNAFYVQLLGDGYREKTIFDVIMQSDQTIGDYLDDNPDNLLFYIDERLYFTTDRSQIALSVPLYECTYANSMREFTDKVYINLSNLGCPCTGVANYDAFKMLVVGSNYQIFSLRDTKQLTGTLASYRVRHAAGSYVSDAHCQGGTESNYYALYIPSHSV